MRDALTRPLVLASASPRRSALLRQVGFEFEVVVSAAQECPAEAGADAVELALGHAREKALDVSGRMVGRLVLGADTVVVLGELVLGKPAGPDEARGMLRALSGLRHQVITAVVLAVGEAILAEDVVVTDVTFRRLTDGEIDGYVATGEPMDKAGAYGIQGRGGLLVTQLRGCYFNVVGLPVSRVGEMLAELGWRGAVKP